MDINIVIVNIAVIVSGLVDTMTAIRKARNRVFPLLLLLLVCVGIGDSQETLDVQELMRGCGKWYSLQPFILSTFHQDVAAVTKFIAEFGADDVIEARDDQFHQYTCLHHAARSSDESALIRLLLGFGAEVDSIGVGVGVGVTPLMFAAGFGRANNLELLLAHGADPTRDESRALYWAIVGAPWYPYDPSPSKYYTDAYSNYVKIVDLLLRAGNDPDVRKSEAHEDDRKSTFMRAVYKAVLPLIETLSKWRNESAEIIETDVYERRWDKLDEINDAIRRGQEERTRLMDPEACSPDRCNGGRCIVQPTLEKFICDCEDGRPRRPICANDGYTGGTDGYSYKFHSEGLTWDAAHDVCVKEGAFLAMDKTDATHNYIIQFNTFMWIGVTDKAEEGVFLFVDGTPVQKTYWDEGEPDNANTDEDCVGIIPYGTGRWNDEKCDQKQGPFLCQKPTPGVRN